jgi:hypothetical protein
VAGTLALDVGNSHVGECVEAGSVVRAAGDGDGGAVHVHLAVADFVEPGPCHGHLAVGKLLGNCEGELTGSALAAVFLQVCAGRGRAASLDAVNDFPHGRR